MTKVKIGKKIVCIPDPVLVWATDHYRLILTLDFVREAREKDAWKDSWKPKTTYSITVEFTDHKDALGAPVWEKHSVTGNADFLCSITTVMFPEWPQCYVIKE